MFTKPVLIYIVNSMAEVPETIPSRLLTEEKITRRLRLSRWLQRGIMVAALSAGLHAAAGPDARSIENDNQIDIFELEDTDWSHVGSQVVIFGSVLARMFEVGFAKNKCDEYVNTYKSDRTAYERSNNIIRVKFGRGKPSAAEAQDNRKSQKYDALGMAGFYGSPVAAGVGAWALASLFHEANIESGSALLNAAGGITLMSLAITGSVAAQPMRHEFANYFKQQLDAVDSGEA